MRPTIFPLITALAIATACTPPGPTPDDQYRCTCSCDYTLRKGWQRSFGSEPTYKGTYACAASDTQADQRCPEQCERNLGNDLARISTPHGISVADVSCTLTTKSIRYEEACNASSTQTGLVVHESSVATNDGIVDFGRSYLDITFRSDGDQVRVPVQGKISLIGGNCPTQSCPMELTRVHFEPEAGNITSPGGHTVNDLVFENMAVWNGTKLANESLDFGSNSYAFAMAEVDGQDRRVELQPNGNVVGNINFSTIRLKASSTDTSSNKLNLDATFTNPHVIIVVHAEAWLADCRPELNTWAACQAGPDGVQRSLSVRSTFDLLGDMASQDLCNAARFEGDYSTMCTATTSEIPRFYCNEDSSLGGLTPTQKAQRLAITWTDAEGATLGSTPELLGLTHTPSFPVTMTVKNEWDRIIQSTVTSAPAGTCPGDELDTYDSETGSLTSGQERHFVAPAMPPGGYDFDMTGTNDADLYVRVGQRPTTGLYDCRPYSSGSNESCHVDLTQTKDVHVMLRGYGSSSTYDLMARWDGFTFLDAVTPAAERHYETPELPPGTYELTMTGSGDADLYTRIGAAPTVGTWDCRPYSGSSNETCTVDLIARSKIHVMVRGYGGWSSYRLDGNALTVGSVVWLAP